MIKDRQGNSRTTLDFSELKLSYRMTHALQVAFETECGHLAVETQRQVWRCCKKLSMFMQDEGLGRKMPLPSDMLLRFRIWLEKTALCNATKQSILNVGISIVTASSRIDPGIVSSGFRLDVRSFERGAPKPSPALSEQSMKQVLQACYEEISAIEQRLTAGRSLLDDCKGDADKTRREVMRRFVALTGNGIPKRRDVIAMGKVFLRQVDALGGVRAIISQLHVTARDILPFYLAILAQTSGNAMAILDIGCDCIRDHPLRADIASVVWSKPRSQREQKADFSIAHRWSAPNLINRLKALNDPLRPWLGERFSDRLFVAYCNGRVAVPCVQLFHIMLDEFIREHKLEHFDFKQLRKTGATIIFRETGDVRVVKERLNHRSTTTTRRYIDEPLLREVHDQLIHRFQGELISMSMNSRLHARATDQRASISRNPSETVFGFLCRDPLAGLAKGSVRGQLCEHFQQCATCPGAIVPLDDPKIVARLLDSLDQLRSRRADAEVEGWVRRFDLLYGATISILQNEIIQKVGPAILDAASHMRDRWPLPRVD
ncbi:tyrosine-type recombinase/integrase [Burkholderia gladioli]|uniref:tyrosine-type recombinase/integrase n=1 Tax=Burkholderia gladioli TaxID=28095 RepID=UPI003F792893